MYLEETQNIWCVCGGGGGVLKPFYKIVSGGWCLDSKDTDRPACG